MMRRIKFPLVLGALAIVMCLVPVALADETWDPEGRWLIEGGGYGEKSFLRLQLSLNGTMDIHTALSGDVRVITGYDISMRLDTSRADVKTWTEDIHERLHIPAPLPELRPTVNEPFTLPPVSAEGLTYRVTLTSTTSGTVDIYGTIDLDVLGDTEINSVSAVWKQGTKKPDVEDLESGCNAGTFPGALLLLPFLRRRRGR